MRAGRWLIEPSEIDGDRERPPGDDKLSIAMTTNTHEEFR